MKLTSNLSDAERSAKQVGCERPKDFMPGPWVKQTMFDHKQLKKSISCLACALLFCAAAYSQQESRHRVAQPDIISDNLEKAAASADQILEVVNKEAGLMVEFKRLLAQDAPEKELIEAACAKVRLELRAEHPQ